MWYNLNCCWESNIFSNELKTQQYDKNNVACHEHPKSALQYLYQSH